MLGKTEGRRRKGPQRMTWLDSITNSMDMNLGGLWEIERDREVWRASVSGTPVAAKSSYRRLVDLLRLGGLGLTLTLTLTSGTEAKCTA